VEKNPIVLLQWGRRYDQMNVVSRRCQCSALFVEDAHVQGLVPGGNVDNPHTHSSVNSSTLKIASY
jgi:glycine/serine hydroxymethyltransferase